MTRRRLLRGPLVAGACLTVLAAAGCASPPPTFSVVTPNPNPTSTYANRMRIVTIGDSIMSGYGLDVGEAWPVLLANKAHVSLTNLACGGMGFIAVGDCGTPYSGFVPALAALQPDVAIVQSSSNDFDEDPATLHAATVSTVQEIHEAAPDAMIIGLSTIWNDEEETPDEVGTTSTDLRDAIALVGGEFLDVGQPLAGHPNWMQEDDVHPTYRGQQAIEEAVHAKLEDAGVLP
ncbi:SGNH/GDSL hydrolase family protein [Microbacterium sp. SORGH_AS_0888]|uniref:SGNH/GDSL hydrolase family protein n=1 Tax=Microbacterium sp. SORGH_AS_0888 TaxID=3041791 RepID=UPI00278920A0|nr:SGNH/GDSL hydrolase family protein [Microbacterium sp. SORGH_AS_0888]MDQ1128808.1 acyl-CoA thioesterase-1 [Microbacterium sp. SORGH_AS_0888]